MELSSSGEGPWIPISHETQFYQDFCNKLGGSRGMDMANNNAEGSFFFQLVSEVLEVFTVEVLDDLPVGRRRGSLDGVCIDS